MGDRKTAAQRVEDRLNSFFLNEWPHLLMKVAAMEAREVILLAVAGSILAGVVASVVVALLK